MGNHSDSPADELRAWVRANRSAPREWIIVAKRMAESPDMNMAWPRLHEAGATPLQIFSMATSSLRESAMDVRRLPSNEERKSLEDVAKAASKLLKALQGAQLLGESAQIGDVGGQLAAIAWTESRAKWARDNAYAMPAQIVVSLPELLRELQDQCHDLINAPPVNAVDRQTRSPEWTQIRSFVRRMAAQFEVEFHDTMPETLARLACAIFHPSEPITGRDVEKILNDSPLRN